MSHGIVEVIFRPMIDRVRGEEIPLSRKCVLHFCGEFALPLCASVLKPNLDLRFCEFERFGKLHSTCHAEVLALLEFTFQCFDLFVRESSSWPLLQV